MRLFIARLIFNAGRKSVLLLIFGLHEFAQLLEGQVASRDLLLPSGHAVHLFVHELRLRLVLARTVTHRYELLLLGARSKQRRETDHLHVWGIRYHLLVGLAVLLIDILLLMLIILLHHRRLHVEGHRLFATVLRRLPVVLQVVVGLGAEARLRLLM